MLFIKVFVSTAWDIFFLSKDDYYSTMPFQDVVDDICRNLSFLFVQQHSVMPDISEMVRELYRVHLSSKDFLECEEKECFVNKYYSQFSKDIIKFNN